MADLIQEVQVASVSELVNMLRCACVFDILLYTPTSSSALQRGEKLFVDLMLFKLRHTCIEGGVTLHGITN